MNKTSIRWIVLVVGNVLVWCVLSFSGTSGAVPRNAKQPFSNAVEQRHEMIRELKEVKALLMEQNALMRAAAAKDNNNERGASR